MAAFRFHPSLPVRSKRLSFYHPKRRGRACRLCTTFTRNVVCQQSPLPRKCNSIVRSRTFQGLMFARFIVGPSQQPRSQNGWWWLGPSVFISSLPKTSVFMVGRVLNADFFFFRRLTVLILSPIVETFVASSVSSITFPLSVLFFKFYNDFTTNDSTLSIVYLKKKKVEIIRAYEIQFRDNIDNIGKLAVQSNASKWLLKRSRLEYSRGEEGHNSRTRPEQERAAELLFNRRPRVLSLLDHNRGERKKGGRRQRRGVSSEIALARERITGGRKRN